MSIPSADIGKCDLKSEIRFHQLSDLQQGLAKSRSRVFRSRSWCVLLRIDTAQHFHCIEGVLVEVRKQLLHFGGCLSAADSEIGDTLQSDCRCGACEGSWQRSAERDRAKWA